MSRINQRLNGLNPLSYLGVDATEPTDFIKNIRDPLTSDFNNFYLGTWWLNTATNSLFYLAALAEGQATWINISSKSGAIEGITGNEGGEVLPTGGNINLVGDGSTIEIVGDPATSTLTASVIAPNIIQTLTGNSGGAVSPSSVGNVNLVGAGPVTVTGDPATSTQTISLSPTVAVLFDTQSGIATPATHVLTINGASGLSTTGSGNTVTVVGASAASSSFITSPATGTATPASGVLTFAAGTNTTISASGSSVTVNNTGSGGGGGPTYSTGTFTPVLNGFSTAVYTTQFGQYTQIGSIAFISLLVEATYSTAPSFIVIGGLPFTVNTSNFNGPCSMNAILNNAITPSTGIFKYPTMWLLFAGTNASLSGSSVPQNVSVQIGTAGMANTVSISSSGFYFI